MIQHQPARHPSAPRVQWRPHRRAPVAAAALLVAALAACGIAVAADDLAIAAIAEPAPAPAGDAGLHAQPVLVLDPGMHTAMINRADVDRAGRLAVTGSIDKTLRLWALDHGLREPLARLRLPTGPGHVGKLYAVAMAPAGDLVAAGGWTAPAGAPDHIYLFNPDGQLVHRIGALPETVKHLTFSPDGRWLAAGLGGAEGIRLYDQDDHWAEAARDTDYGDNVYGLAFAPDGRLATTSLDGQVRLYDARFHAIGRRGMGRPMALEPMTQGHMTQGHMTQGERPFGIAFHPDGDRLAVGFDNKPALVLLDGRTLAPLAAQPDLSVIDNGSLSQVVWSRDGATLYAAGRHQEAGPNPVLAWSDAGTGARRVVHRGALSTVMSLKALPDNGLLVAAQDPHLAVLGAAPAVRPSPKFDPRAQHANLAVSADGLQLDFGFEYGGDSDRHRFDLAALRLEPLRPEPSSQVPSSQVPSSQSTSTQAPRSQVRSRQRPSPAPDPRTAPPRQSGLPIADWEDQNHPRLDGKPLPLEPYERSRSLAIHPDGQRFLLGADWSLRAFDAAGEPLWRRAAPSVVYAVNITGDGRLAVAAYGDGTLRWHRMDDGRELLACFPMSDRKNWVAWTPEGFYGATAGAHGVLKWHVNRG